MVSLEAKVAEQLKAQRAVPTRRRDRYPDGDLFRGGQPAHHRQAALGDIQVRRSGGVVRLVGRVQEGPSPSKLATIPCRSTSMMQSNECANSSRERRTIGFSNSVAAPM